MSSDAVERMTAAAEVRAAAARLWPGASGDVLDDRVARAAWTAVAEPSDGVAGALTRARGAVGALERAGSAEPPVGIAGVGAKEWAAALARWGPRLDARLVIDALSRAGRSGLSLIAPGDEDWPAQLDDLGAHAPIALWVRGERAALSSLSCAVSIVGARAATGYGEHVAGELSGSLAGDGAAIVSGGAYGIDGAAHRAAVQSGGVTIAVMAGGADRVYPAGHAHLLQRIAESGAVLSEVAPGTAPTKFRFLRRNRLIAALGCATVVVEAATRSGSLSTAAAAAELGRPLGAVPGSVLHTTSAGCHRLLREFDAVCVTSADDVRELMGLGGDALADLPLSAPVDPVTLRVRDALSRHRGLPAADVATRAGVAVPEATAALGLLHIEGAAREESGLWRLSA